jgi:hypothetical protein
LPFHPRPFLRAREETREEDELSSLLDLEDEEVTEKILPFLYVRFRVPPLMLCTAWMFLPTVNSTRRSPSGRRLSPTSAEATTNDP